MIVATTKVYHRSVKYVQDPHEATEQEVPVTLNMAFSDLVDLAAGVTAMAWFAIMHLLCSRLCLRCGMLRVTNGQ